MQLSETRRRAEQAWGQLTRRPLIVERRRIRPVNLPEVRQGRFQPVVLDEDGDPIRCQLCAAGDFEHHHPWR